MMFHWPSLIHGPSLIGALHLGLWVVAAKLVGILLLSIIVGLLLKFIAEAAWESAQETWWGEDPGCSDRNNLHEDSDPWLR